MNSLLRHGGHEPLGELAPAAVDELLEEYRDSDEPRDILRVLSWASSSSKDDPQYQRLLNSLVEISYTRLTEQRQDLIKVFEEAFGEGGKIPTLFEESHTTQKVKIKEKIQERIVSSEEMTTKWYRDCLRRYWSCTHAEIANRLTQQEAAFAALFGDEYEALCTAARERDPKRLPRQLLDLSTITTYVGHAYWSGKIDNFRSAYLKHLQDTAQPLAPKRRRLRKAR